MKQVVLEAQLREKKGKEYCKKLRRMGVIPAVIYGKAFDPMDLQVPDREFKKSISQKAGLNAIYELKVEKRSGDPLLAMVANVQKDPLGKMILHIDFHKISLDVKVTATVPLHLTGEPKGIKKGGNLEHLIWKVEIETLPLNIPDHLTLDVTGLDIDEGLAIKDIPLPDGVKILENPEEMVAVVHTQRAEEAAAAPEEAIVAAPVSTQPEVVKKAKEDKEK
jgi:large subunit ribosomal protein L25